MCRAASQGPRPACQGRGARGCGPDSRQGAEVATEGAASAATSSSRVGPTGGSGGRVSRACQYASTRFISSGLAEQGVRRVEQVHRAEERAADIGIDARERQKAVHQDRRREAARGGLVRRAAQTRFPRGVVLGDAGAVPRRDVALDALVELERERFAIGGVVAQRACEQTARRRRRASSRGRRAGSCRSAHRRRRAGRAPKRRPSTTRWRARLISPAIDVHVGDRLGDRPDRPRRLPPGGAPRRHRTASGRSARASPGRRCRRQA